jgi:putative Holliday junction resolvase
VLKAQNGVPDWNQVEALIKEWKPDAMVVGLPLNMDGTPQRDERARGKFARRLNGRFNLPLHTHDERLTTLRPRASAWPGPARQLPRQPGGRHRRRPAAARLAG